MSYPRDLESRSLAMAFCACIWPSAELGERINFNRSVPTITPIAKARDVKTEGASNSVHSASQYPVRRRETSGTGDRRQSTQFTSTQTQD